MIFYAPFCIPFLVGLLIMVVSLLTKYSLWFYRLSSADKRLVWRGIPSTKTLAALREVVCESLLHLKIFKVNPLLGYMHMSLAFGWFLLIFVGWVEIISYFGFTYIPIQGHVFFKYFATGLEHKPIFEFLMDLILLIVLSGVTLALCKRIYSKAMGMRRTTKHSLGDRVALSALWFIFPARLIAESATCGLYGGDGFLTGGIGGAMADHLSVLSLIYIESIAWWFYASVLGIFLAALPFSRYMHIFTEIPLIFLRNYRLKSTEKRSSFDNFQVEACSKCGICIDPCQLQGTLGIKSVQSVYFLKDRRQNQLTEAIANNCLMCGRCDNVCPVGIDLTTLRLNSRDTLSNVPDERRFEYLRGQDKSMGRGKVGYFAGCMTLLTPRTISSMEKIFKAVGEEVWWADRSGGVCCGRPLKLSGETDSAKKMVIYNRELFYKHGITTLVTSCPICLKIFRDDYDLEGIEVLHHSEYILNLLHDKRLDISRTKSKFTYHDPCELGRGSGIYDQPRAIIEAVGELLEPINSRAQSLCCGSSLANRVITDAQQVKIAQSLSVELEQTGAEIIVTACPLCKKAIGRGSHLRVQDLSEVVALAIK